MACGGGCGSWGGGVVFAGSRCGMLVVWVGGGGCVCVVVCGGGLDGWR